MSLVNDLSLAAFADLGSYGAAGNPHAPIVHLAASGAS